VTQPTANCPNCGAKITFRWSASVQTVCEYCKSILVRTDVDLQKVGQVADLPPNSSPIQIGTEGVYGAHSFVAIGRIVYEYDQGNWNEWHLMMNDGTSGWLSDAQDEYAVTFAAPGRKLPKECRIGQDARCQNGTRPGRGDPQHGASGLFGGTRQIRRTGAGIPCRALTNHRHSRPRGTFMFHSGLRV